MNNTIQNLFGQVNALTAQLQKQEQHIIALNTALQAKGARLRWPAQQRAGVIDYPGYMPFPFIQEIEMNSKSKTSFGKAVELSVGSIKIDIDLPVYLERLTASLVKIEGQVSDGEEPPGLIADPGLQYYLPLSFRTWRFFPAFIDGAGVEVPLQRYLCDFQWRAYFEKKQKNITNDWLHSSVLDGDEQGGYRFDCEYPLKRGETLTIEAQPLKAIANDTDGFKLVFYAHMIKMLLDPAKIAQAREEAEEI